MPQLLQTSTVTTMTVEKARQLLGDDIAHLSDDEVMQLNAETASLCGDYLRFLIKNIPQKQTIDTLKT